MSEYDHANFTGIYAGESLLKTTEITSVPWEIGEPQPIVCEILDSMSPGRLLDVGCGLGRNAKAAFDRSFDVVAIDISSTAIEKCREFYSSSNITFQVLDACHTALIPGFNVILDSATYHAIPAARRVNYLMEMHRLASKDTIFHLITFAPSLYGMPKPLSNELSEIASTIELSDWRIRLVERVEYKGNAAAIDNFRKKKRLDIKLDNKGRTRLPAWHFILQTSI